MSEKFSIVEDFGCQVFNDAVMRERLPRDVYESLRKTMNEGTELPVHIADVVAGAMKDWAIEQGATHYTHWFQPMTGITAEKHDSFIEKDGNGGAIMKFSGKNLIRGESDASSFPSGGLRATFEARGYTAWDPTSYAFVKEGTLYIPTAFCSFSGEVLDKKTPLLRSMEVISEQSLRILRLFGNTTATRVTTDVGAEQEYFLVDRDLFKLRRDMMLTGRTLFGARAPKGQEMDDHYFGHIKPRVAAFMKELDEELWKLGIYSKTKHNEVAPSQHEMAPIFETTNIATDHNQLTMEIMRSVAQHHDFALLLHEKPYAGVNGSGKHNNWSIGANDGENLLDPGKDPQNNLQYLLFFSAVIKAVDEYAPLLRASVASAGNDHRLGANEAPPAIVSVFIGSELEGILEAFEKGSTGALAEKEVMELGVTALPNFTRDSDDRNRTSPFALTGNKFEFRMAGSSANIATPNTVLNTIIAEELRCFADRLEQADDLEETVRSIIRETYRDHKRIIFNGNNYSEEWVAEAKRRGLPNLASTVDALPAFIDPKTIEVFSRNRVLSETELRSRYEIQLENYSKTINIEALTMLDMARKQIRPAVIEFNRTLCEGLLVKERLDLELDTATEAFLVRRVSSLSGELSATIDRLDIDLSRSKAILEPLEKARFFHDIILTDMEALRTAADELETLVGEDYWPIPTYVDLLY